MLIRRAQLAGACWVDIRVRGGRIVEIAHQLMPRSGERVLDAGGAVLPGLHDHHLHLYATAAAMNSICCGPPSVTDEAQLVQALHRAAPGASWLRGVAYHESVAGLPDRWRLDGWVCDRPLRIQHRSGKMWLLNSAAIEQLGLDREQLGAGVERDSQGRASGRLFRMDDWLGRRLRRSGAVEAPQLAEVSLLLARYGVTGVTDAGAANDATTMASLLAARQAGQLRQRVLMMGVDELPLPLPLQPGLQRGAVKILLDDHRLPVFIDLGQRIVSAHRRQRPVAIHCVTATELVFALSALRDAGPLPGDRIEHASLAPDDALPLLQQAGVTVVTQPIFIYQRGDQYRGDVPAAEQPLLYRARSFLAAGIPLAGGSDAPYGDLDPWRAMRTAVRRRSRQGYLLGAEEALDPEQALALYTGSAHRPGAAPRRVAVGEAADLCVLDRPWQQARERLCADDVLATVCAGALIYRRAATAD